MAIEHAAVRVARKPWGVADLRPWSTADGPSGAIGELSFHRSDKSNSKPTLLLKLLFTSGPLSIQVHPDDAFAHSIGLPNGKTEAWYILSATPGAQVAAGLKRRLRPQELRASIKDGSIADLTQWRSVVRGDVIFIPAGTIHAIGAGIVLAEIQQRSDTTFRLFDYGRGRELHEESAVAVADAGPLQPQSGTRRLTKARTLLIDSPHFVLERIDFLAGSKWALNAASETWLLVIEGRAQIGLTNAILGDAIFIEGDNVDIEVGPDGMSGLIAYPGPHAIYSLLQDRGAQTDRAFEQSTARSFELSENVEHQT